MGPRPRGYREPHGHRRGPGAPRVDASAVTAPSVGPNTVIEKDDPEERLARHEQSETDAMGLDKRRQVVGGRYSPTIRRQLAMYGIFLAIVAAIAFGCIVLANELDKAPKNYRTRRRGRRPMPRTSHRSRSTSRTTATRAPTPTSRAT